MPSSRRQVLRHAAGNFYINDKPTGAMVGLQPFGGAQRVGHQRQGGRPSQSASMGKPANHQGDIRARDGLSLPLHGRAMRVNRHGPLSIMSCRVPACPAWRYS